MTKPKAEPFQKSKEINLRKMENQIEIYQSSDGQTQIEVAFEQDTVWLTQQQMATLFNQTKQNISLHINNCSKEGESSKEATVKQFLTVQLEGLYFISRDFQTCLYK